MKRLFIILLSVLPLVAWAQEVDTLGMVVDTAIMAPMQVKGVGVNNFEDLNRVPSGLDLQDPENVNTTIEYDPTTGCYVVHTRIGDVDIATPYMMTESEYRAYSERQEMGKFWQAKIGEVEHNNESKFDITDMKFNIGPADKIFGPGGVQLKLQGSAELLFGFKHQFIDNPALTQRSRNNNIFDFDEKIQLSVNGKVGEKLGFNMSYNTEASFSFDQQNIKLNFKGQEDDIIQSLEAGNVSMTLNNSLIRGSSALFGIKADLKFGKLRVQALVSQQNSESQSVSSQGGAQTTNFEVAIDNYDENRHFFLSYYFRDNYEQAMKALPYVASGVTINRIEVWVTNKRANYDQSRNIVALTDLGEYDVAHIQNNRWTATAGAVTPYNKANTLYEYLTQSYPNVRDIQQVSSVMQDVAGMDLGEDYEKIESARLLSSSEYTLNAALGYISLRSALNQDEVLAVAYEYTYAGKVYQVGEFSTDAGESLKAPNALLLKMLKSSNNAPILKNKGTWDLMMKNVYSIGASQMSSEKFELYVQYRNDSVGTDMQYLMEGDIKGKQLIRVMGLDRLDSRNNASPDGRFDYVEGYTAVSSSGRIIFPVLEPFGSHLAQAIGNPVIAEKYVFQELYDSTLVSAQEYTEKNKFTLVGKYKGSAGNEIRLNAMNIPRGSVVVTAGGATLVENVDYTVDYTMGTVTILNESILESGTNVDVKLENQATFSMQRKSLFGAHLEYEFNKDLTVGGTIMHMNERPITTKVNTGSEPLANTIWGVNANWKTEMQWLTLLIDKVPWINATAPSTFQIKAEFAHLIPGHTKEVGQVGTAYIDDFEATKTNIDIHYPSFWRLASTPRSDKFPEYALSNDLGYNKNRALLAWYTVDPIFGKPSSNTPKHIKDNVDLMCDHRTRTIYEEEVYPNKQVLANADTRLPVLNLSYYPQERGPYNISADEIGIDGNLTNPQDRWGGIMRKLDNTDFEKSNIEYIEFWLMDPFLTNPDINFEGGDLYIDLGDISEDILRDGKKSFEHGLPLNESEETLVEYTVWGRSPRTTSTVVAFANEAGARAKQDVGLDGLTTEQEIDPMYLYYNGTNPYAEYVAALSSKVDPMVLEMWKNDPFSPLLDPAGDNYHYYRGSDYDEAETPILQRYKRYNGTEGNSPEAQDNEPYGTASTLQPDIEDINNDNTLNDGERFYRYRISLRKQDMARVGQQNIASIMETNVKLRNDEVVPVKWYQFKIPLKGDSSMVQKVGNIRNFKSIRFARIFMTNFKQETHIRFASFDLVRGEWRNYTKGLYQDVANNQYNITKPYTSSGMLDVQAVNIEENSNRTPVNYVLPPGISRQTDPGQAQLIAQNEQAMVLRLNYISPKDARAVYKNVTYDMRQYKRLQMFVHAECLPDFDAIQDKDLTCFIRLGSDLKNNYYEYAIPLYLTPEGLYNNESVEDRLKVWLEKNTFDFPLSVFTDAKTARNKAKRAGNANVGNTIPYEVYDPEKLDNKITVMGNPTLEDIQSIMIGVRNNTNHDVSGEVWVNELRLSQFNEQGGVAAMANASLSISDIAQLNVAGRLETAGYGSIESNVLDRNMDNMYQLSVSAALEAGRLFPEKAKLQIPLYVSYSNETLSPDYDPLDTDIKLSETLNTYETQAEKDSIRSLANTVQEATSFSVTNMKVDIHSKKRNMFYDPANFSVSASYNKQSQHTPEVEQDVVVDQKGSFNYSYNFNPQPWEPFKNVKGVDKVKFLKEMNFYYLPQSWAFNTTMHRTFTHMKMRDFSMEATGAADMDLTFSKDFTWDRNFDFKYDLTKNMKFTFQTAMNSTVDEGYYTPEIIRDYAFTNDYYEAWKDTIQRSLATWGTPYTYQQLFSASWNVPLNRIPYLEAITANASYNATYNWNRTISSTAQETANLGNVVSSTRAWQVDGGLNFETLYGKSKYWKQMNQRFNQRTRRRPFRSKTYNETVTLVAGEAKEINHRLGSEMVEVLAETESGKPVKVKVQSSTSTQVTVVAKKDMENVKLTIKTIDQNQRSAAEKAMDMAAYFGTMLRKVQVTYRNTNSLTLPGFAPQAGFMGQTRYNDLYAPGFDFAFGFFDDSFVEKAKSNGWLSGDTTVVQPASRTMTSDFDVKVSLEPFPGFKIQLNGKRYAAESSSIIYSFDQLQENMTGSFNITQVAIGTAFQGLGSADDNFASDVFNQFLNNREIIAGRVQGQYKDVRYPNAGFIPTQLRGEKYDSKYGAINNNTADVLVPAFLAAYTGRDPYKVRLNPFMSLLQVLPNWSVTFDGLGKLPWVRDHFKSVNITHAYTCKYAIGSYSSYSTWMPATDLNNKQVGFIRDVETENPIPSSAYDISSVNLTENFSPLIGLNLTMKNSLSAKVEYRKQRNISLNVTSVQISEGHTDEFVIGAGYTIKDLNFITKSRGGGQKKVSNDLKLNVDVSYKDVKTLLRKVEENITQASSGNKVFGIKISADYVLSQKINLQLFYDHQGTTPLISSSYPTKADNFGINIKLMLTR
ncbi:MAG: cell surface protein SprA [Paludibacteraceae bacterium]|nr:cell surface protein SprA [Paludibacteraceae bacterium]